MERLIIYSKSRFFQLARSILSGVVLFNTLLVFESVLASIPPRAMCSKLASVSGTITYHSTTQIPANAIAYITLVDVSPRQDSSGEIITRQTLTNLKAKPIAFKLNYDPAKICANCTYAIQVQLVVQGKVIFRNASAHPVLTCGNPSTVNVMLKPV